MSSKKQTKQDTSSTTTLPAWMTSAGEQNYNQAQQYLQSGQADWTPDKMQAYRNPYVEEVQNRTLTNMRSQQGQERAQTGDAAMAAKAYGGTRYGVVQAQQLKDQDANIMDYLARSNADSYDSSRAAFEADRAAKLGGYQTLTGILAGTPRNVSTTGNSTSTQKGSWIDTVLGAGQIAASFASDPRLKRDVSLIERLANGLGIYRFRYVWDAATDALRTGFMADEVERIVPSALGPRVMGFRTVDYRKLKGALA